MDILISSFLDVFSPISFLLLLGGIGIGIIFGSIPGLTATMGVALLLPVTFGLGPVAGILLLVGVYVGGISGGLVAATLLGIPGTPSSIATTFDAYPMSKNGEPVRAMGIGIVASLIGGIFSFIILITISPFIARIAVKMGPSEYVALIFLALTLIAVLSSGNMIKGITSGIIGMSLALIGFAPIDGTARYTFGQLQLTAGIDLLPLIMGLFAITQIHMEIQKGEISKEINLKVKGFAVSIKELLNNTINLLRSSSIGVALGMLPGMGSGASNLIAYAQAKQASKNPEKFGKGAPEGIYASESANNASVGGALVPMMTLGIPGDSVTAILLGGFMIHGIQPGPLLFTNNAGIVNVVFIGFFLSIIIVFILQFLGMRLFPKILTIPQHFLYPILLTMTVVGAFAMNHRIFDVWIMLIFGVVGFILIKNNYPIAPLILGFVLGPMFEIYLRRAFMAASNPIEILYSPVAVILITAAIVILIVTTVREVKDVRKKRKTTPPNINI
ncbi:tripartite tricarboxylate transporter permease [Evansella sp. AB-P1]|uniref:tripartite tricarboxylate transporter permease n=1 Tax=Evansella sp. AB-P1 TaxID=3037653 RepID=UPI00241C9634|nr:tripartite tricarboxylate transporter permease [Evansella sp. AB-P1]MDG5788057.1 tripartite tricarboxylate transporter permease [Evansella sp. AB-P1]